MECVTTTSRAYSYAFQPIVDIRVPEIYSYEALIRGPHGESAGHVLAKVEGADLYDLDRESRVFAVDLAGRLALPCHLNVNVLPRGLGASEAEIRALVDAAGRWSVPPDRLILEVTEREAIDDHGHFVRVIDE